MKDGGVQAELEHRWRDLGEFIREQRRVGHLSLRKLSEMAGISNPYLSQIERGLRKPSAEILQQIARALEISSETLYVRAGILEERDGVDLIGEIRRDPFLTEEQKKTLVRIYTSFRHENDPAGGLDAAPAREENAAAESSGTAER
jgi:transcriptional regulator with XRE-family HTH domain